MCCHSVSPDWTGLFIASACMSDWVFFSNMQKSNSGMHASQSFHMFRFGFGCVYRLELQNDSQYLCVLSNELSKWQTIANTSDCVGPQPCDSVPCSNGCAQRKSQTCCLLGALPNIKMQCGAVLRLVHGHNFHQLKSKLLFFAIWRVASSIIRNGTHCFRQAKRM